MAAGLLHWREVFVGKGSLDNMTFRLDLHFSSRERVLSSKLNQILLFHHIWHFKQWNGLPFPQLQAANNEKDIQGGDTIFLHQQQKTESKATQRWSLTGNREKLCQAADGWQSAWPKSGRFPGNPGREVQDRRESERGWGRKAQWLAGGWGLGRKSGWTHWQRGAAVQMENDVNKDVGRIPGEGRGHRLKEHLAK